MQTVFVACMMDGVSFEGFGEIENFTRPREGLFSRDKKTLPCLNGRNLILRNEIFKLAFKKEIYIKIIDEDEFYRGPIRVSNFDSNTCPEEFRWVIELK